ncbi:MAG: Re/Si-specific NAD(P)(+) transhydrogenase subunit alpha [Planctomycetota bacterium]|nr:Re/Si-specific NAD(P)(+) transhydrogenase subunit alpha [Planctomycetota bacterium]
MQIAVLRETREGETRVGLIPEVVSRLIRADHSVVVESGAGVAAGFLDAAYEKAGATVATDAAGALDGADLVVRIQVDGPDEIAPLPEGVTLVSFIWPVTNTDVVKALVDKKISAFAMDCVPRITRAQSMDALSSMSTVAGYRAALFGAQHLGKFFPMLMTAAGTIPPGRVVVIGVGVAGLQAIATCRRLGAIVEAYDIRAEAREQAKSLGADAIEVELEESGEGEGGYAKELSEAGKQKLAEKLAERIKIADCVITTALVPGRPAPRLIEAATVEQMKPGAVIVDLAAETGGNCELTEPGQVVTKHNVTIVGTLNLPATMPTDASRMYSKNIEEIVRHLTPDAPGEGEAPSDEKVHLDFEDEITDGSFVAHAGDVRHAATREAMGLEPLATGGDA